MDNDQALIKFSETNNPIYLYDVAPESINILLENAPTAIAKYKNVNRSKAVKINNRKKEEIYLQRSLDIMDILSESIPIVGSVNCGNFNPLDNIKNSCYLDSVSMALFAVPNDYITNAMFLTELTATKKPVYMCSDNKNDDLKYRKSVQKELAKIALSFQGKSTLSVQNCTNLRSALEKCPGFKKHAKYHKGYQEDAGEYLEYILNMFPHMNNVLLTIQSQLVEDLYKQLGNDQFVTIGYLLNTIYKKNEFTMDYFVVDIRRNNDPSNSFNLIPLRIFPTERFTADNGNIYNLTAIVAWTKNNKENSGHYTAYIKCGLAWFHYDDDANMKIRKIGEYNTLLAGGHENSPNIISNSTIFFYKKL